MERSANRHAAHRRSARISQWEAVERAEAYLRAHVDATVSLAQLCRIAGLSERGLRNAFYGVRGLSPKRCTLRLRLQGVRRDLREAVAGRTTVTSVATRYGFYELGRFAGAYKAMFGEVPSATLRRAIANRHTVAPERQPEGDESPWKLTSSGP